MKFVQELLTGVDALFWLAVAAGIMVKLTFSELLTKRQVVMTFVAGVFCAVLFSRPTLDVLKLEGEYYAYAVAGLLALTGEHIVRRVVKFSQNGSISDIKKGIGK